MTNHSRTKLRALLVFSLLAAPLAQAQAICSKDSDCPGSQVCRGGSCISTGATTMTPAPFPPPPPTPPATATPAAASASPDPTGSDGPMVGTAAGTGFAPNTFGLQFALPSGGGPTLGGTWFINGKMALHLDFGLDLTFTNPTSFGFSMEAGLRVYLVHYDRIHFFVAPGLFVANPLSRASFALIGAMGVELFLLERLSIGASTGVALRMIDGFSATNGVAVKFTTGTSALLLAFYF